MDWEGAVIRLAATDTRGDAARLFPFGLAPELKLLCGWRTRGVFDRYNIIHEADLALAVAKRFNGKQAANMPPAEPGVEQLS